MDWTGWYTIAVLVVGVGIMAKDTMGTDFAMMVRFSSKFLPWPDNAATSPCRNLKQACYAMRMLAKRMLTFHAP